VAIQRNRQSRHVAGGQYSHRPRIIFDGDSMNEDANAVVSSGISLYIVAKWLGDGYEVIEKSYGHLAPNTGQINKVVR
jgi:hypothetical protein